MDQHLRYSNAATPRPLAGGATFPGASIGFRYGGLLLVLSIALFAAIALFITNGLSELRQVLVNLPAALAVSAGVHIPQIVLTALAWRCLLPPDGRPAVGAMVMLRWFRESASTLVPAGAVAGQIAAARLLTRWGVAGALAAATATMDVTVESASQAVFTLAGLGLLLVSSQKADLLGVAVVGSLLGIAGILALVALQGGTALQWCETLILRRFPKLRLDAFRSFRLTMAEVRGSHGALAKAFACHSTAWVLGSVEIYGVLTLLHHPVSWTSALVIESLSQAMRIAGFMLPGALAVQEGAIIAAAALVGVSPESALAIALVRRARELIISLLGVLAWTGTERAEARRQSQTVEQGI